MSMIEKIPAVDEVEYSYDGYFDLRKTYKNVYGILGNFQCDVGEKLYNLKSDGKGGVEFAAKATAEAEFNDFLKIVLMIGFKANGSNEEVSIDGVKKNMTKGNFKISIRAYIEPEWGDARSSTPLLQIISLFKTRLFKQPTSEDEAINKAKELVNVLKEEFYKNMF